MWHLLQVCPSQEEGSLICGSSCIFKGFNFSPTQFECLRTVKVTSTPFCFTINMNLSSEEGSLETLMSALNNCIAYMVFLGKKSFCLAGESEIKMIQIRETMQVIYLTSSRHRERGKGREMRGGGELGNSLLIGYNGSQQTVIGEELGGVQTNHPHPESKLPLGNPPTPPLPPFLPSFLLTVLICWYFRTISKKKITRQKQVLQTLVPPCRHGLISRCVIPPQYACSNWKT